MSKKNIKTIINKYIVIISFILNFIMIPIFIFTNTNKPIIPIGLLVFILSISIILYFKELSKTKKALLFNFGIISLFIVGLEIFFNIPKSNNKEIINTGTLYKSNYFTDDDLIGYRATKNSQVTSKKMTEDGQVFYDVTYTINKYGLRVSPHDLKENITNNYNFKNILFFGGSFTFGEGVNDDENLPWKIEEKSNYKLKSYNFGFHGYGPHQMLRTLELGLIDNIVDLNKSSIFMYLLIPDHIDRASGNYPYIIWGSNSPRYIIDEKEIVKYDGMFKDKIQFEIIKKLESLFNKSSILNRIKNNILGWKRTKKDVDLLIKIIEKSNNIIKDKYNSKLNIIFWYDINDSDSEYILKSLKDLGINVYYVRDIVPDMKINWKKYMIEGDGHPSKYCYDSIAEFLIDEIDKL